MGYRVPGKSHVGRRQRFHMEIPRHSKRPDTGIVVFIGSQVNGLAIDTRFPGKIEIPPQVLQTSEIDRLRIIAQRHVGTIGIEQDAVSAETGVFFKERKCLIVVNDRFGRRPYGVRRHDEMAVAAPGRRVGQVVLAGVKRNDSVIDIELAAVEDTAAAELFTPVERRIFRAVPRHGTAIEIRGSGIVKRAAAAVGAIGREGIVEELTVLEGHRPGIIDTRAENAPRLSAVPVNAGSRNRHRTGIIDTAAAAVLACNGISGNGHIDKVQCT